MDEQQTPETAVDLERQKKLDEFRDRYRDEMNRSKGTNKEFRNAFILVIVGVVLFVTLYACFGKSPISRYFNRQSYSSDDD